MRVEPMDRKAECYIRPKKKMSLGKNCDELKSGNFLIRTASFCFHSVAQMPQ